MTDEDATYYAETMGELERQIISFCSTKQSFGYSRLAEMTGRSYADVQQSGQTLTAMNLARIEPTKLAGEFSGSAIFLNKRGEQVRLAVALQQSAKS